MVMDIPPRGTPKPDRGQGKRPPAGSVLGVAPRLALGLGCLLEAFAEGPGGRQQLLQCGDWSTAFTDGLGAQHGASKQKEGQSVALGRVCLCDG